MGLPRRRSKSLDRIEDTPLRLSSQQHLKFLDDIVMPTTTTQRTEASISQTLSRFFASNSFWIDVQIMERDRLRISPVDKKSQRPNTV